MRFRQESENFRSEASNTAFQSSIAGRAVGPDFGAPSAPVADKFIGANSVAVNSRRYDSSDWWKAFRDPTLDRPVRLPYDQNLTLSSEVSTNVAFSELCQPSTNWREFLIESPESGRAEGQQAPSAALREISRRRASGAFDPCRNSR
jgi:hypothetical protein